MADKSKRDIAADKHVQSDPVYSSPQAMDLGRRAFLAGVGWSAAHFRQLMDYVNATMKMRDLQRAYYSHKTKTSLAAACRQETYVDELGKQLLRVGATEGPPKVPEATQSDIFKKQ